MPDERPKSKELVLHGDISGLKHVFINRNRKILSCPMSDSICMVLQRYPGGASHFFEDAVNSFDGNLPALLDAAVTFVEQRKYRAPQDPIRNVSGRVSPETFAQVQQITDALGEIRGVSRAKVVGGLVQLYITRQFEA